MRLIPLILTLFLTGCITINNTTPTPPVSGVGVSCPQYRPPKDPVVPPLPTLPEGSGNYVGFLEEFTETLAMHVRKLGEYIQLRQLAHERAYREYVLACKSL